MPQDMAAIQRQAFQDRLKRAARGGAGTMGQPLVGVDEPARVKTVVRKSKRVPGKSGLMWWIVSFGLGLLAVQGARRINSDLLPWLTAHESVTVEMAANVMRVAEMPYAEVGLSILLAFALAMVLNIRGLGVTAMLALGVSALPLKEAGHLDGAIAWAEDQYTQGYVAELINQARDASQAAG